MPTTKTPWQWILTTLLCLFSYNTSFAQPTSQFVSLSDIHFDPFIACQNARPCLLIDTLRAKPVTEWKHYLEHYDQTPIQYGKDTNYPMLKSALTAAKNADADAEFVVILGDFLGHNYKEKYKAYTGDQSDSGYRTFVRKTFQFLTLETKAAFQKLDVYNVVGNNDAYADDYESEPSGQFFKNLAFMWGSEIHDLRNQFSLLKTFPTAGYYSVDVGLNRNLHLIVLNSTLFSNKAIGVDIDKAALKQIDWLRKELNLVAKKHQKALILTHIPLGVDVYSTLKQKPFAVVEFLKPSYSQLLENIFKDHSSDIIGILAGHTHADSFQLLTQGYAKEIPMIFTSSVTPCNGNNSGFKIFEYASQTEELTDFTTYFYDLSDTKTWKKEYTFSEIYNPNCLHCAVVKGMNNLNQTGELAESYKKFFDVGTSTQPIVTQFLPYYWCSIRAISASDYKSCVAQ